MKKTITTITSLIACACASYAAEVTVVASPAATVPSAQPEAKAIDTLADEVVCANFLERFSSSITMGFESEYIFRGKNCAGASLNPQIDMAYDIGSGFGVYGGVWANTPVNSNNSESEIDYYAGVTYDIKNFTFDLGYAAYTYTADSENSHEIKFAVTYDTVDLLGEFNVSPTAGFFYDFTLGVYTLEAGATYSAPLQSGLPTETGAQSTSPRFTAGRLPPIRAATAMLPCRRTQSFRLPTTARCRSAFAMRTTTTTPNLNPLPAEFGSEHRCQSVSNRQKISYLLVRSS